MSGCHALHCLALFFCCFDGINPPYRLHLGSAFSSPPILTLWVGNIFTYIYFLAKMPLVDFWPLILCETFLRCWIHQQRDRRWGREKAEVTVSPAILLHSACRARRGRGAKAEKPDERLCCVCSSVSSRRLSSCIFSACGNLRQCHRRRGRRRRKKRKRKKRHGSLSCLICGSMTPSPCQPLLSPW